METHIPNYEDEPNRKSRISWFLIAVIVVLCIVVFVQGVILFGRSTERGDRTLGRAWQERLHHILPGLADKSRLAPDNQVVYWDSTDDLEQIHNQINRLLRGMTTTFGASMSGGAFPGIALQRESGNRPRAMPSAGHDLNQLQQEIEQIFTDAYNESQQNTLLSRFNRGWEMVPSCAAMNIEEQGSNYVVTVALPGFDKQGISISLEGRLLIIEAAQPERVSATSARNAPAARRGQFHTQIMMPDNIQGVGAQAVFDHDVLRVHIPKAVETNSLVRSIAIR